MTLTMTTIFLTSFSLIYLATPSMFRVIKRDGGTDSSTGVELSLPILKFPRPARGAGGWRCLRRRPMVANERGRRWSACSATEPLSDT